MRSSRYVRIVLLAALVAAGATPVFVDAVSNRETTKAVLVRHFDGDDSGLRGYVASVEQRIPDGEAVAFVHGDTRLEQYQAARMRVAYLLPGRTVIPLIDDRGNRVPSRVDEASWILAWRETVTHPEFREIHRSGPGSLLERTRP